MAALVGNAWHRITNPDSFTGQVSLTMVTNVVIAALGVATGLLSARLLGPQGRGELAAIQSWPTLLAALAMLGLDDALVYFTSRTPEQAGRYLASALVLVSIGVGLAVGLGWAAMPWLLHAQSPAIVTAAQVFLLMAPVYALAGLPHQVLRAVGAWSAWNVLRVLPNLLWLIALLVTAGLARVWATPVTLSRLYLAYHVGLTLPFILVVRRYMAGPLEVRIETFCPLLRYGLPGMLNILPRTLNLRLDQLLMAAFLEPRVLGLYVVAVAWAGATTPLLSAIGSVLFPRLSAVTDPAQQRQRLGQVIRLTLAGNGGLTLLLLAITPAVVPLLFGIDYAPAVPVALVLVVANSISNLNLTLADGLRGLGRPQAVLKPELVGLCATVVFLALLLRPFGALGAAIASLLAYAVTCANLGIAVKSRRNQQ